MSEKIFNFKDYKIFLTIKWFFFSFTFYKIIKVGETPIKGYVPFSVTFGFHKTAQYFNRHEFTIHFVIDTILKEVDQNGFGFYILLPTIKVQRPSFHIIK